MNEAEGSGGETRTMEGKGRWIIERITMAFFFFVAFSAAAAAAAAAAGSACAHRRLRFSRRMNE